LPGAGFGPAPGQRSQPLDRIAEAGLPSLYARLIDAVLGRRCADAA